MKSLAVRVLGDFAVDGVEPVALGSRKARQALHLLALGQGRSVPSDVLIDALWPDGAPARPEDQLSVLFSRLRAVLGRDRIRRTDAGYQLRYDWLDAAELDALVAEAGRRKDADNLAGAVAAARVALALARGYEPGRAHGDWAVQRHLDLERLVSRARRVGAEVLVAAGDWTAAADAAAAALERDPYDEAALRVLMRAQVTGGQLALALACYASARERLADDLGTDPSPETQALHTAILRGEVAAAGHDGHDITALAAAAPDLVGRDDELRVLDAATQHGSTPIVIIEGEAGIGKTALLRAWCARRSGAEGTVVFASCGPLDQAMPLDALLSALGDLLRRLGTDLLGADRGLLAPLLRTEPGEARLTERQRGGLPDALAPASTALADSMLGPAVLYAALTRLLARLADRGPLVVAIDDAHLAGRALADLLRFMAREQLRVVVVATARAGEGEQLPSTARVRLRALDLDAVAELVGPARATLLYERSGGHPLFLTELAQQELGAALPASLVESVSVRCDELGSAGSLLRAAAVIGPELDVDLLAALLGRGVVDVLDDAEQAVARQFLTAREGKFRFRHELVQEALAASATAGRRALLHRQAGRVLARQPGTDPATVARHARLGGDVELASAALGDAAARAAERFDHAAAEALLDDALALHETPQMWLARARVRTRRGRYDAALRDVERATAAGAGPAAFEVGAWVSYFDRRFDDAAQFADDGALAAADVPTRARCLAVGGRVRHAVGDLARAEALLTEALSLAEGADRATAAAWLGVLRAHQSRADEAIALLRPASRGQIGVEHTSATLHGLLFLGHALALSGQPAGALASFARYTEEVQRRQVPRFAGRAVNFSGWVLRSLGARREALDRHQEALEVGRSEGTPDVMVAALSDLAEQCVADQDADGARSYLGQAAGLLRGDLVFGWRLGLKMDLIGCRLALLEADPEGAAAGADELAARATALGVPRYASLARLLGHRARSRLGQSADPDAICRDLDLLDASVGLEAWWWTGDVAADCGNPVWLDRAAERAIELAANAGPYSRTLLAAADRRMRQWRAAIKAGPPP